MEVQAATTPADQKVSRWEDYIDVFFSPVELFRRRATDRVMPPLLTLIALGIGFYLASLPATEMAMRAGIANAPPEAAAQMTDRMVRMMAIFGAIFVPIMYTAMSAMAAAVLWLGGRIADMRTEFGRTMLIATYASFILLLSQIAGAVLVIVLGEPSFNTVTSMSFGVLRFIGNTDMNPLLIALLQRFDIFAIWQAVLCAIGLRVIYDVSNLRAGLIAAAAWFLFIVPGLLGVIASLGRGA